MEYNLSDYGFFRVAVASPEMIVAGVRFNTEKICEAIDSALKNNCHFIVFPELCITGYTCGDLFFQKNLIDAALDSLKEIASCTYKTKSTVIVGAPIAKDGRLFDCAVFISNGEIKGIIPKTYLSNYNEYYEERWFTSEFYRDDDLISINGFDIPFGADLLFSNLSMKDCLIGIEICEDLWSVKPPSLDMALAGANVLLNLSASNEYLDKFKYRKDLVISQSGRCIAAYCYSSAGANESSTDLVFSGHSMIAENGSLLAESEKYQFNSQIIYSDIDVEKINNDRIRNKTYGKSLPANNYRIIEFNTPGLIVQKLLRTISDTPFIPKNINERAEKCKEIFDIQTTALAKRLRHIGCKDVIIGISGGLDSTLALLVCIKTYEKLNLLLNNIHAISMPGFGTSDRTKNNAAKIADYLKINFREIPINKAVELHFRDIGHNKDLHDIVYENAQARERTQILMDIANEVNGIVVGTGDLSEIALGWSTYNGDHISMYAVNCGVPKTLVNYIIEWCADELFAGDISKVLKDIISTPISPELLPSSDNEDSIQETEKAIGPYLLNDFFLYYFQRCNFSPNKIQFLAEICFRSIYSKEEIIGHLKIFYERFFKNQFKRTCIPDGPKVGTVALSPRGDWRMPSDSSYDTWLQSIENI
jgi:NAD+ synthase (glutamine-hydrolysing)